MAYPELRRQNTSLYLPTIHGELRYDEKLSTVHSPFHQEGEERYLTPNQGRLLSALMEAEGKIVSFRRLTETLWKVFLKENVKNDQANIRTLMNNIRRELNEYNEQYKDKEARQSGIIRSGQNTYAINTPIPAVEEAREHHESVFSCETEHGRLTIYPERFIAISPLVQKPVHLTKIENVYFTEILSKPDQVITRTMLTNRVKVELDIIHSGQDVRAFILSLRKKLEGESGTRRELIYNSPWHGYTVNKNLL